MPVLHCQCSARLGALGGALSGLSALFSGITGAIGASKEEDPVADQRLDTYFKFSEIIGDYIKVIRSGVEAAYNDHIGQTTSVSWYGSAEAIDTDLINKHGIFGTGDWFDSDHTTGVQSTLIDNLVKVVTYRSINYAWTEGSLFIMYVPYGVDVMLVDGSGTTKLDQAYCESLLKNDDDRALTNCNAGGGMARLFDGSSEDSDPLAGRPMGYNAKYTVVGDEVFSTTEAIAGSVASWQAGDFNYDVSSEFAVEELSDPYLSMDTLTKIGNIKVEAAAAGFFNIPVCKVLDLRGFPPAQSGVKPCGCGSAQAVGGKPGSTAGFMDNVDEKVKSYLETFGVFGCSFEIYTG